MTRRPAALGCILLLLGCTAVAVVVSGSRPAIDRGIAPMVVQGVGYGFGLVAALLLLAAAARSGELAGVVRSDHRAGGLLLGAVLALAVLDVSGLTDSGNGASFGAGLLRLLGLLVAVAAGVLVAVDLLGRRRARP